MNITKGIGVIIVGVAVTGIVAIAGVISLPYNIIKMFHGVGKKAIDDITKEKQNERD